MENKRRSKLPIILPILVIAAGAVAMAVLNPELLLPISIMLVFIDLILIVKVVSAYNRAIKLRNKVAEGLSLVDIHLKMRFDLVPNLVRVVKGYAEHEKELFKEVTALRKQAISAENETDKIDCANKLLEGIKSVVVVAEAYPELKSSSVYKKLMTNLAEIEDRIVASRRIYDSNVNFYNTHIEKFPNNVICGCFGFTKEKLFKVETGERIAPEVDFDLNK